MVVIRVSSMEEKTFGTNGEEENNQKSINL